VERSLPPTNEFSRKLVVDPWPEAGIDVDVDADPAERQALARRFDLLEVRSLRAHGRIERLEQPAELVFRGWLAADVVQTCVLSLEPVPATIRQAIERRYRPGSAAADRERLQPKGAIDLDDEDEEVEPVNGREIDLGEAIAEEFGLALDPYPRALGAAAIEPEALGPHVSLGQAEPEKPFAALRQLREEHPRQ
jgi:uncharacterized metal-binding protein YceD (DUF177 family)